MRLRDDWRDLGYDSYADYVAGSACSWSGDYHLAYSLNQNLVALWPRREIETYATYTLPIDADIKDLRVFDWEWQGRRYSLRVLVSPWHDIGARHVLGCVYAICGVTLAREERIRELVERHGIGHSIDWDRWDSIRPVLDGGSWNSKYYSVRQFMHLIPARLRCVNCGKRFKHWDGQWKWQVNSTSTPPVCSDACSETITERDYRAWRRNRARQIQQPLVVASSTSAVHGGGKQPPCRRSKSK